MSSDGVSQIAPDLAALIAAVTGLGTALANNEKGLAGAETYDGQARTSAQAALVSKNGAAASASTASTGATNASGSASSAATSSTNAGSSATAAANSATLTGTWASAASASATSAATFATNATNAKNAAALFKQVQPVAAGTSVSAVANTTWNATVSFTAPCAGWVFALGSFNLYQPPSAGYICNLLINGNNLASDSTGLNQRHMAMASVTSGEAVTVQMQAVSGATAPQQGATLHVVAWFLPAP